MFDIRPTDNELIDSLMVKKTTCGRSDVIERNLQLPSHKCNDCTFY